MKTYSAKTRFVLEIYSECRQSSIRGEASLRSAPSPAKGGISFGIPETESIGGALGGIGALPCGAFADGLKNIFSF